MSQFLLLCVLGCLYGFALSLFSRRVSSILLQLRIRYTGVKTHARVIEIKERSTRLRSNPRSEAALRGWRRIVFFQARNGQYVRTSLGELRDPRDVTPLGEVITICYLPEMPRLCVPFHEKKLPFPASDTKMLLSVTTAVLLLGFVLGVWTAKSYFFSLLLTFLPPLIVAAWAVKHVDGEEFLRTRPWEDPFPAKRDDAKGEVPPYLYDLELYPPEDEVLANSLAMVGYGFARSVRAPGVPGAPISLDNPEGRAEGGRTSRGDNASDASDTSFGPDMSAVMPGEVKATLDKLFAREEPIESSRKVETDTAPSVDETPNGGNGSEARGTAPHSPSKQKDDEVVGKPLEGTSAETSGKTSSDEVSAPEPARNTAPATSDDASQSPEDFERAPATQSEAVAFLQTLRPTELIPWMTAQAAGLYHRELFALNRERPASDVHPTLPAWVTYGDEVNDRDTAVWLTFREAITFRLDVIDQNGRYRGLRVETDLGGQPFADALRDLLAEAVEDVFPEAAGRCALVLSLEWDPQAWRAIRDDRS